ncbi:MAG: L,D-transpeptidase family protein [Ilumatobacteraceae bacterium]|nr:L,D-transpeptidase family protein [Ilumatobacteraceae bacterium]
MKRHRRHREHDPELQAMYTRRRFLVASAAAAVPLGAWWSLGSATGTTGAENEPAIPTPDATGATTSAPPTPTPESTAVEPAPTPPTSTVPVLDHELVEGMVEPEVEILQQRLTDLAFDPGPIDGYFGASTLRSVWAFQKLVMGIPREDADGIVTPEAWARLHDEVVTDPRRTPGGTHLEIYLPEQVAVLFIDGRARVISHVSSGEGVEWCDEVTVDLDDGTTETKGICGRSVTPGGVYHFERKVEGWRNAKLGRLYKPVYFNYGIAIHGASNVPSYPASRGCVRYPMHIADYIQDLVEIDDMVYVFDGVEEPEHYGAQPMIFDWPDPDYTTTTTSTTTTTTTTVPESTTTTSPPTTTTSTPTTTTVSPPATTPPTTQPGS